MNELYTLDPRNIQNNHSNNNGKVKLRKKPVIRWVIDSTEVIWGL